jgi:hypothetical protein
VSARIGKEGRVLAKMSSSCYPVWKEGMRRATRTIEKLSPPMLANIVETLQRPTRVPVAMIRRLRKILVAL